MHQWESLSHVQWDGKYHVIFIPKYRKKVLYGKMRKQVGAILRSLCRQRDVEIIAGKLCPDHVHMCLAIPPKHSVSSVMGFLKGKSAVRIHRNVLEQQKVTGLHFWAPGYCVSTVGLDEETIKKYIRRQEALETGQGELNFK
jgi:putative transposase